MGTKNKKGIEAGFEKAIKQSMMDIEVVKKDALIYRMLLNIYRCGLEDGSNVA
jgi:hypothetical protein